MHVSSYLIQPAATREFLPGHVGIFISDVIYMQSMPCTCTSDEYTIITIVFFFFGFAPNSFLKIGVTLSHPPHQVSNPFFF